MKFLKSFAFALLLPLICAGHAQAQAEAQPQNSPQIQANEAPASDSDCVYAPSGGAIDMAQMQGSGVISRGINLSRWWQDAQDRPVSANELRQLRDQGFDFVRLPVSPSWAEIQDPDERKKKLAELRCDIVSILNTDMSVVLDLHAGEALQNLFARDPNQAVPKIEDVWRALQPVVAGLPPRHVLIELFNEPLIETNLWWRIQGRILDDLRRIYPDNTMIASSGPFDGWWNLIDKKAYDDLNVIYDFHFYEPMIFTHHGADWLPDQSDKTPSPIVYPVRKDFNFDLNDPETKKYVDAGWDKTAITKIIGEVAAWRDYYRVRVVCLEFGVYRAFTDDQSRYNWLRDAHDAFDGARIPWALWEYRGPFGLMNQPDGGMDTFTLRALGLNRGQNP